MIDLRDAIREHAAPGGEAWLGAALSKLAEDGAHLPILFPQLPRRLGREFLPTALVRDDARGIVVELGAWRVCDAGGLALLGAGGPPSDEQLLDLYDRGDLEERTMVLRALACLPVTAATGRLLGEAQRTNHTVHVVAAVLDSNLLARALREGDPAVTGFGPDEFTRLVLKIAFLDLPLRRMFGAAQHATAELSSSLQHLATEREAAGRKVWFDTNRVIGHAPTSGTVARLVGGLEQGEDQHRLAAAEGVLALGRPELRGYVEERLEREEHPDIRAALTRARDALCG